MATTYFSSSSGGRTVSAAEGTGKAVPYLLSVPDPYDTLSPYHDWGPVLVDAKAAARAFGLGVPLSGFETSAGPSGRIATVTALGPMTQVTLSGSAVRDAFGLRSTWSGSAGSPSLRRRRRSRSAGPLRSPGLRVG